jgi:alpha-tubulin suppressor-like RCC1 family protein
VAATAQLDTHLPCLRTLVSALVQAALQPRETPWSWDIVPWLSTHFSSWSFGSAHSLGVRQNGTAWAWGNNCYGRLGDNTIVNKSSPVSVVGGFTNWCQVAAGGSHSLGLKQDSTPWAWGLGLYGSLGDNSTVSKSSPVSVVGGFTDWCQVAAGYRISAGIRKTKGF